MSARVAVITDLHANLPATEAVLTRIAELEIDEIYCSPGNGSASSTTLRER
jgi:hypothetical protein